LESAPMAPGDLLVDEGEASMADAGVRATSSPDALLGSSPGIPDDRWVPESRVPCAAVPAAEGVRVWSALAAGLLLASAYPGDARPNGGRAPGAPSHRGRGVRNGE
jgi:hypothetical protein